MRTARKPGAQVESRSINMLYPTGTFVSADVAGAGPSAGGPRVAVGRVRNHHCLSQRVVNKPVIACNKKDGLV